MCVLKWVAHFLLVSLGNKRTASCFAGLERGTPAARFSSSPPHSLALRCTAVLCSTEDAAAGSPQFGVENGLQRMSFPVGGGAGRV